MQAIQAAERGGYDAPRLVDIPEPQIVPAHDRSFPLERAPEAPWHLIEDRPFGTVTLTVGGLRFR
jgi:hypothetical protein